MEAKCDFAEAMIYSKEFKVSSIIRLVLAVIGVFLAIILIRNRNNFVRLHANAKLIMLSYLVWTLLMAVSAGIVNATNVLRY